MKTVLSSAHPDKTAATEGPASPAGPDAPKVLSVPQLKAIRGSSSASATADFKRRTDTLATDATQTLVVRVETAADPLVLWALHLELDKRDVPPCVRWPANEGDGGQLEFITFLADLLWICKRNPGHITNFRGWRGAFKHSPDSEAWHAIAHRQYIWLIKRGSLSHQCAKGLALVDGQRLDLMVLQTNSMQAERRKLQTREFEVIRVALQRHALLKPDRSKRMTPTKSAERRAKVWRVYLLSGRRQTAMAANWRLLTGETVSRQALMKTVVTVASVLRVKV
ncbi:hypothetical protein LNV08_06560 [Paucibacter sp. TC2R-5]|uniref:hypothetical protein n=1 Tax=Paucibacter sp. TC2R-5 TaxID=2893555 RepID=UPI0021E42011|nr:hypothetical protein [Paucibacter sp. TC2R-5]MCV2358636.1 hypothetical protein [Paucibacter sp. TC2R-5]